MKRLRCFYANPIRPVLLTKTDNASSVLSERRQGPNPVRSRVGDGFNPCSLKICRSTYGRIGASTYGRKLHVKEKHGITLRDPWYVR